YMYQTYFAPPSPPPAKATTSTTAPAQTGTNTDNSTTAPPAVAATPAAPAPPAVVGDSSEHQIVVDTPKVQAVFTNRGGRLLHWRLKDYRDSNGRPVDLVPSDLPQMEQLPFSLRVD